MAAEECGIYGCDGARWTEKCRQGCSREEVCKMYKAIDRDDEEMRINGVCAFGKKWGLIRSLGDDTLLFRGKGEECKKNMVVTKSNQAVIVACCGEDKLSAQGVVKDATTMRDHLHASGY